VHLKDLNVLPQSTRNTKPKPLLQQQKLEFKTTAFFIKNTPYQKKKKPNPLHQKKKIKIKTPAFFKKNTPQQKKKKNKPTHSFQTKKKPHN